MGASMDRWMDSDISTGYRDRAMYVLRSAEYKLCVMVYFVACCSMTEVEYFLHGP